MNYSSAQYPLKQRRKRVDQMDADLDIPDGDVQFGKRLFNQICLECHRTNVNSYLGPALGKIFNATVGKQKGYKNDYSLASKAASFKWTEQKLFLFLQNPDEILPGNTMIFYGMKDPHQISSIIEYLKYIKEIGGSDDQP